MNWRGRRVVAALVVALLGGSGAAAAQSRIMVDVRGHAARPTGALSERWGVGVGFAAGASVDLVPNYGVYGTYSNTVFDLDPEDEAHAVDSGFSAGLIRHFAIGGIAEPWLATGVLVHELDVRGLRAQGGENEPGFEIRGGIRSPLLPTRRLRANLEVGYRQHRARILSTEQETVSYFTAGVGLSLLF